MMKGAIPIDRPLFETSPKAHLYGADVVALAHTADRASGEHDVTVVLTSSILKARAVVDSVGRILVCVPHLDPTHPGRGTTDILPETLVGAGACVVMPNHVEHLITFTVLEKTMQCAAEVGLTTAVCVNFLTEIRAVASLDSDLLVAKPTEPIGTDKPSGFDYVETSNRAVREINPGMRVLQGAGILTSVDVEAVIRNGTDAMGSSSTIATASNPSIMAEAMIRVAHHGWDTCLRSRRPTIIIEREKTMKVYRGTIDLQSTRNHLTFHNVTKEVKAALKRSGMKDRIAVVYSHHMTCLVLTQECSHDKTYYGLEYFQQDLVNTMEHTTPQCLAEGQYMYPEPAYIRSAMNEAKEEGEWTNLNMDACLRSIFFGRSETIVVVDGELNLGEFSCIYFVNQDQIRDRPRQCQVQTVGG